MALSNESLSLDNVRTIKEAILDEEKLVTYITLSKDLCIHVNEAKALLKKVVEEIKGNNSNIDLNVTYLISGLTGDNAGLTTVCSETELDTLTITFKTIFYQHIFSVCRGSSGVDNAALASINRFEDILLCAGLIKGSSCTKRTVDEIGTLKSNSQKSIDEVKTVIPIKNDIKERNSDVTQINNKNDNDVVKVHDTKSEPVIKSEVISPKKDSSKTVNGKSTVKNGKPSKGIAGFFTKSNSAPNIKSQITKEKEKTVIKTETKQEVKKEIEPEIIEEEQMDVDVEIPTKDIKNEPESTKKSKSKKNSSLTKIKKNAKVDKKRKRVLHVSDSESDENDPFADEKPTNQESEDEIPPTPTVNTVKITSGILNPKKRRKMVDKTYTDEEGYILTRKEEVYESCSDEEVEAVKTETVKSESNQVKSEKENVEHTNKVKLEVSPKEKKAKNSKKKVSPPQKGKQGNIMNFFKKI